MSCWSIISLFTFSSSQRKLMDLSKLKPLTIWIGPLAEMPDTPCLVRVWQRTSAQHTWTSDNRTEEGKASGSCPLVLWRFVLVRSVSPGSQLWARLWAPLYVHIIMFPIKMMLELGRHKKQEGLCVWAYITYTWLMAKLTEIFSIFIVKRNYMKYH